MAVPEWVGLPRIQKRTEKRNDPEVKKKKVKKRKKRRRKEEQGSISSIRMIRIIAVFLEAKVGGVVDCSWKGLPGVEETRLIRDD